MRPRPIAAVVVLAAALALSGCSAIGSLFGGQAVRDGQTGEVTDGGQADVFSLQVGDCLNDDSAEQLTEVPLMPCDEPHDNEVYHDFTIGADTDEWPGQDSVDKQAEDGCYEAFSDYVGMSYEDSRLDFGLFSPTEDSWASGDRVVSCYVYDMSGKVTGTLEGAAR